MLSQSRHETFALKSENPFLKFPIAMRNKSVNFVTKIKVMPHKAIDIAKTFLTFVNPEYGDFLSNLKLQKLLYYAQGSSLALHHKALFEEKIVAWQYGPVVEEVYHEFKNFSNGAILQDESHNNEFLSDEELDLLREVYEVFGQFSATKLVEMTHNEMPWVSTKINNEITHQKLKRYFLTFVQDEQ